MARSIAQDYLQDYAFWLFDIVNVPVAGGVSFPMFNPLIGFSSITAPEMTAETEEIAQADWYFNKTVLKKATTSPITLTRGVTFYDNDFYNWMTSALKGYSEDVNIVGPSIEMTRFGSKIVNNFLDTRLETTRSTQALRRDLILIQFFPRFPRKQVGDLTFGPAPAIVAPANPGEYGGSYREPARAFYLKGAVPTRYKPNSDFDATSSAISIQELDLSYEYFEQVGFNISLGVK